MAPEIRARRTARCRSSALFREMLLWNEQAVGRGESSERGGGPGTCVLPKCLYSRVARRLRARAAGRRSALRTARWTSRSIRHRIMPRPSGDGETVVYAWPCRAAQPLKSTGRMMPAPYTVDGRPTGLAVPSHGTSLKMPGICPSAWFASRDGEPDVLISAHPLRPLDRHRDDDQPRRLTPGELGAAARGDRQRLGLGRRPVDVSGISARPVGGCCRTRPICTLLTLAIGRRTLVDSIQRPTTEDGGQRSGSSTSSVGFWWPEFRAGRGWVVL